MVLEIRKAETCFRAGRLGESKRESLASQIFSGVLDSLGQRWRAYGTRATSRTRDDFTWQANIFLR